MPRTYTNPYMSVKEVAEIFGVKEITVREWCRNGILEGIRPRRNWRIKRTSVNQLLQDKFGDDNE